MRTNNRQPAGDGIPFRDRSCSPPEITEVKPVAYYEALPTNPEALVPDCPPAFRTLPGLGSGYKHTRYDQIHGAASL